MMKILTRSIFALQLLLIGVFSSAFAADLSSLKMLTEEFAPYNFYKNGVASGSAIDLLVKASAAAEMAVQPSDVRVQPWARAYDSALAGPNVMIFSMTRTPEREAIFKWAGPIDVHKISMIARKGDNVVVTDPSAITLKVGVIRDDSGDQLVTKAGVKDTAIYRHARTEGMAKMLAHKRVDMWAYSEVGAFEIIRAIGENPDDYEVVHVLSSSELYYAFSLDVDDELIARFQKGIDAVK